MSEIPSIAAPQEFKPLPNLRETARLIFDTVKNGVIATLVQDQEKSPNILDRNLTTLLQARLPSIKTIPDVIKLMQDIENLLPDEDGLKWFNQLYKMVTEAVEIYTEKSRDQGVEWLKHLDVEFAKLYFEGILKCLKADQKAPQVWQKLMDNRYSSGLSRLQFAALGLNAHINRDLMLAIVKAFEKTGGEPKDGTPEHQQYLYINTILDLVEVEALEQMATGPIKTFCRAIAPFDRFLIMKSVSLGRAVAWKNSKICCSLGKNPRLQQAYIDSADQGSARIIANVLLIPTEPDSSSELKHAA